MMNSRVFMRVVGCSPVGFGRRTRRPCLGQSRASLAPLASLARGESLAYRRRPMFPRLAARILRTTDPRCLAKFMWNFGVKGLVSVEKFKRRIKRGEYFPPFLYLSILNSCNLRCQGCWVDVEAERTQIDLDDAEPHDQRREGAWERLLRHPRRRTFHAPGAARSARAASRLLFPDFHQRPVHHRENRAAACGSSATPRRWSPSRAARSPATSGAARRKCFNRTLRGLDHCLRATAPHRRRDQRLPDEYRRSAARKTGCAS